MSNITQLISTIDSIHSELQAYAAKAVNKSLTVRNWLIGFHIVEYEQNGEDRAEYGDKIIKTLADKLSHIKGIDRRSLFKFRQFYLTYQYLFPEIRSFIFNNPNSSIVETVTPQLQKRLISKTVTVPQKSKVETTSPQLDKATKVPANVILSRLSYSHIENLLKVKDPLKRVFYELECIKGTWSVRGLKRQISSLYFERSGLSEHPEKLSELTQQKTQPQQPKDIIKNIYAFEFLNLSIQPVMEESDLETALLDQLQQFIIELGNGFCLEARQKRILIGENYYFIDLVFYHRILKCHALIELKIGAFQQGDIGQLNTYLNYFKSEIAEENDNPPVGILLVAEKDQALVKYATAGMDENLFVQQYLIRLPSADQLKKYVESELKNYHKK